MRENRGLIGCSIVLAILLINLSSAFWPLTGNAVESGARPTIISTSPSDSEIHVGAHQLISLSFTASDSDADMNHMWMQVWKEQSTSNTEDFFIPFSGYNNPSGFYTGVSQNVTTAKSKTFTFSLPEAGTYYVRFAVRDIASNSFTEEWKTIFVGEKGSSCGADNQCMSGLQCSGNICNDPSSTTQISNLCQSCDSTTQCAPGMFCDSGVCRYNSGNVGESCQQIPLNSACVTGYIKPCVQGLTCTVNAAWDLTFGFLGTPGVCQNLSVGLGQHCDTNNKCLSGLKCDSQTNQCVSQTTSANSVSSSQVDIPRVIGFKEPITLPEDGIVIVRSETKTLQVSLGYISTSRIRLNINGIPTDYIYTGSETIVSDKITVKVSSISFDSADDGRSSVVLVFNEVLQGTKDLFSVSHEYCASTSECKVGLVCDSQTSQCVRPTNGHCEGVLECGVAHTCENNVCKKILNAACSVANPSECRSDLTCKVGYDGVNLMCSLSAEQQTAATQSNYPLIHYLEFPSQVIQGQNLVVNAYATVSQGNTLKRHRLCILNASIMAGCEWTNTAGTSLSINNAAIPTLQNQRSFYRGIGQYTLRYEVEDNSGKMSFLEKPVTVLAPSSLATVSIDESNFIGDIQGIPESQSTNTQVQQDSTSGISEPIVNNVPTQCSSGCLSADLSICYPAGHRRAGTYCNVETRSFIAQKADDTICENNFECSSNFCATGKCINASIFQKLLELLKSTFGNNGQ